MGYRPTLPDEIRTTLPRIARDYIDALETELSVTAGEAAALRARLSTLETGGRTPARHEGWPPGFIEQTAGAWQGEPPTRPDQGTFEEREPIE